MYVMSQVDLLYRLQQIDDETSDRKKRLGQVTRLQQESRELQNARQRHEKGEADLLKWSAIQGDLNLELGSLVSKLKREEDRLYSGTIANPKELSDIQHELEALDRRRAALEDELLDAMIYVEDAQEEEESAQRELVEIEALWSRSQQELRTEESELVERINELKEIRKRHLSTLSPDSIKAYENAIRRAGATAVVPLRNNRCGGCQVTVPVNLVKNADEGRLVTCDSCTRILCPV